MTANLTYFRSSGKYYSGASVEVSSSLQIFEIWALVASLSPSPGLSLKWTDGPILVEVPGHIHDHPHLIMPNH